MKTSIGEIAKKRREYVYQKTNEEAAKRKLSNKERSKLMKKFWRQAKLKYK